MGDITPRKEICIVTLSEHLNYTHAAIAKGMQRRRVFIYRKIWCMQEFP